MSISNRLPHISSSEVAWAVGGAVVTVGACAMTGTGAFRTAATAMLAGTLLGAAARLYGLVAEWCGHVVAGAPAR